jgi:hypothetical protein
MYVRLVRIYARSYARTNVTHPVLPVLTRKLRLGLEQNVAIAIDWIHYGHSNSQITDFLISGGPGGPSPAQNRPPGPPRKMYILVSKQSERRRREKAQARHHRQTRHQQHRSNPNFVLMAFIEGFNAVLMGLNRVLRGF